jgi:hypothetical protein
MRLLGRTPWPVVATAVTVPALVLLVSVLPSAERVLPLVGRIAELALAGGAAYLVDDAAATLTTVAPKGTWRRRSPALVLGTALLAGGWAAVLLLLRRADALPAALAASGEPVVLGLVAVAAATVLVRSGDPEPGARVGPALVLLGIGLLIAESVLHRPLLLPWQGAAGTGLTLAWVGVALLSVLVALWASRDPAAGRTLMR